MSYKIHEGQTYAYAHSSIQCWADKEGCQIFEVDLGAGVQRVLAPNEQMAEDAYREENACPDCNFIVECCCDDEDFQD